jgi:hypothetical protein
MEFLHEKCHEEETERDRATLKRIRMVLVNIQTEMVEIAATYNKNVNNDSEGLKYILIKGDEWIEIDKITTKQLKRTMKVEKKRSLPQILM